MTKDLNIQSENARNKPDQGQSELFFDVRGMHCAGCAASVQRALQACGGVEDAAVNLDQAIARVSGIDLKTSELLEAITNRGFEAEVAELPPPPADLRLEIEQRRKTHEQQWRRRAITGLLIWIPLEVLHWSGQSLGMDARIMHWIMASGATMSIVLVGGGFFRSAWRAACKRTTNMDTLIALGATSAYVFSMVMFFAAMTQASWAGPMYFAEASALLAIISLGHWIEARATTSAGSALRALLAMQPETAMRLTGARDDYTSAQEINSADVRPEDLILIRPGGRVPVDGVVVHGASDVDESIVTGESRPVSRGMDDTVVAGAMNLTGVIVVRASVDGRNTTVSRLADLVTRAQASPAQVQRIADRVCAHFVPAVLLVALVTVTGWWLAGDVGRGVIAAVTVLVISCPCALGLATPMAVMVGTGAASRLGILVKDASVFERAGRIGHVIFDKTGTLTTGALRVTSIQLLCAGKEKSEQQTEHDILQLAASVESASEHPVAHAVVTCAHERNIDLLPVTNFRAMPGQGVCGIVNGRDVEVRQSDVASCAIIIDGINVADVNVADDIRPDARSTITTLRQQNIAITMLTGDSKEAAQTVGAALGLKPEEITARATPASKLQMLEDARKNGVMTAMVGDGLNDAASLAAADVGIALASGTNLAMESADVVIPGERVASVTDVISLSRQTLGTIHQNLFFAFFYNALAIPLAAFGVLGAHGPLIAAAAMGLSDFTVVGNALRLRRRLKSNR